MNCSADTYTAGVSVLNAYCYGLVKAEFLDDVKSTVGIVDVVIGELFAVELFAGGKSVFFR